MTIKEALTKIEKDWAQYPHSTKDGHEAVWIAQSNQADSYEVDEEWIGMKGDGSLVWAYASGCSCWDGDYSTAINKTVKAFALAHKHTPKEWEKRIIEFAKTGVEQLMPSYDRYA